MNGNDGIQIQKKKRQRKQTANKKWIWPEEIQILNYIKEAENKGYKFEKPTAKVYYEKMLSKICLDVTDYQLKNKVQNLKKAYSNAIDWANQTGQGVDTGSVESYIRKMCPHFDDLRDIFGQKASFVLPYLYDNLDQNCEKSAGTDNAVVQSATKCNQNMVILDIDEFDCGNFNEIDNGVEYNDIIECNNGAENNSASNLTNELNNNDENMYIDAIIENTSNDIPEDTAFNDEQSVSESHEESNLPPNENSISRFRTALTSLPKSKNGFKPSIDRNASNAAAVISKALMQRADAILDKTKTYAALKREELMLEKAKFEHEKLMQIASTELKKAELDVKKTELEVKKLEVESSERIKILELEKAERLEELKLRLDLEKYKLMHFNQFNLNRSD